MNIVVRYPALVGLRRHLPTSGVPLISVSVPLLIPVNPHVITAGRSPAMLDNSDWWTKTNYDVSSRGAESQRTGENNSDQPFVKHNFLFLLQTAYRRGTPRSRRLTSTALPGTPDAGTGKPIQLASSHSRSSRCSKTYPLAQHSYRPDGRTYSSYSSKSPSHQCLRAANVAPGLAPA
jgi:hypothetical protein